MPSHCDLLPHHVGKDGCWLLTVPVWVSGTDLMLIREWSTLCNCVTTNGNGPTRLMAGSCHVCEMSISTWFPQTTLKTTLLGCWSLPSLARLCHLRLRHRSRVNVIRSYAESDQPPATNANTIDICMCHTCDLREPPARKCPRVTCMISWVAVSCARDGTTGFVWASAQELSLMLIDATCAVDCRQNDVQLVLTLYT